MLVKFIMQLVKLGVDHNVLRRGLHAMKREGMSLADISEHMRNAGIVDTATTVVEAVEAVGPQDSPVSMHETLEIVNTAENSAEEKKSKKRK